MVAVTRSFVCLTAVAMCLLAVPSGALAGQRGTNADTVQQLSSNDVYIAPEMFTHPNVRSQDLARLRVATADASHRGVPIKIGIISHYPSVINSPTNAAEALRNTVDFSGVLILVTPRGIGISSDQLSSADSSSIERSVQSRCRTEAADCAIRAVHLAVPRVLHIQSEANRNAAVFWAVSVGLFGLVVLGLVLMSRRKRLQMLATPTGSPTTPSGR